MTYWAFKHPCCTCEYWDGPRQIKSDPRVIECPPGAKGVCCGPNRSYRGKTVQAGLYVGNWRSCYELKHGMEE